MVDARSASVKPGSALASLLACEKDVPRVDSLLASALANRSKLSGGRAGGFSTKAEESRGTGFANFVSVRFPSLSSTIPGPGNPWTVRTSRDQVLASMR